MASTTADAEPPQKKQRQEPEAEEGKDKEEGAQGFPADTLFRCQRVVELLLQHPYVPHFNQAMGQPNLMTIHVRVLISPAISSRHLCSVTASHVTNTALSTKSFILATHQAACPRLLACSFVTTSESG